MERWFLGLLMRVRWSMNDQHYDRSQEVGETDETERWFKEANA
jgi:hypothetical protein